MIIDQLPTISNVQNSDELPIERGQTTYKTTVGKVVDAVSKIVADEYDNTSTYAVGDYCVYEGTLYVCNTAISTAEEWNASHWTATNVTDEIPSAYNSNPEMNGTASPGSSTAWAKGDHVHPSDTSKQDSITATGILKGNGSGGVSAAVAGTDYLTQATNYSPVFRLSPGASHAITSADSGKTFVDSYSSTASTLDILLTLSQADSSAFPVGAEIALTRINSKSTKLTVSGVRLFNADAGIIGSASGTATIQISPKYGMAAIKKIEPNSATYGDVWLLTGNVEVVT